MEKSKKDLLCEARDILNLQRNYVLELEREVVNEHGEELIQRIAEMKTAGHTEVTIAKELGLSVSTVRVLRSKQKTQQKMTQEV